MRSLRATIRQNKSRLLESTEEKDRRFLQAANDGNVYELGLLLGSGDVDVNCRGDLAEWTPLHNAASNGHAESIEMLIEKNAIIDITDMFGCTPLFYAVRNCHSDVVKILLNKRASTTIKNKWGETPMDMSVKNSLRNVIVSTHSFDPLVDMEQSTSIRDTNADDSDSDADHLSSVPISHEKQLLRQGL